jgi:hypothetical protein
MNKQPIVKIEIRGGVAYLTQKPAGVIVIIQDHDNPSEETFKLEEVLQ